MDEALAHRILLVGLFVAAAATAAALGFVTAPDRKSTRLNSSHYS